MGWYSSRDSKGLAFYIMLILLLRLIPENFTSLIFLNGVYYIPYFTMDSKKMKLKTLVIWVPIISAILAIIINFASIIKWIFPQTHIEICYDKHEIYLPNKIREGIWELNNRPGIRYSISPLLEKLEKSINLANTEDGYKISILISIINNLTSTSIFNNVSPVVYTFQVKNRGSKTARNLKILFPRSGYFEVYMKGSPIIVKESVGVYIFDSLQPNEEASIYYWPSTDFIYGEMKASHENGTVKVIKGCR
jgi:hypothetical protein